MSLLKNHGNQTNCGTQQQNLRAMTHPDLHYKHQVHEMYPPVSPDTVIVPENSNNGKTRKDNNIKHIDNELVSSRRKQQSECYSKPGATAVPGMKVFPQSHNPLTSTVVTEGYDALVDQTVQVDNAVLVVTNIGIAEPVFISQVCSETCKGSMMESRVNHSTMYSWLIRTLILSSVLSISIVLGVCLSGHCKRSPDNVQNDPNTIGVIKDSTPFVAFSTTKELVNEVDKVLDGTTNNTIYGRIEDWDVSLIQDFSSLFSSRRNIRAVSFNEDISRWNMSSATDTSNMFWIAWSFNNNLSTWDMSRVKDMSRMFNGADVFEGIGLERWNTSCVENMQGMFAGVDLFDVNLSGWDVSHVVDMSYLFTSLANRNKDDVEKPFHFIKFDSFFQGIGLDQWNTSQVKNMKAMFEGASFFNADLSRWVVGNVEDMSSMFADTEFNGDLSVWNTSHVMNMSYMFYDAHNFSGMGLENWDVSRVQTMESMFWSALAFRANLSTWNTSKVSNMATMFSYTTLFDSNLSFWDTSQVIDMTNMFLNANTFRGVGLDMWDVSHVNDMSGMVLGASAFNANLSRWNVSQVSMMSMMFYGASSFRGDGLDRWDVNNVQRMDYMFAGADMFDANLSQWNVSQVTDMSSMFSGAVSFLGNGLNDWDVSHVTNMISMFTGVYFDANLSLWNVGRVTDMSFMFYQASYFHGVGLNNWDVSRLIMAEYMFQDASSLNVNLSGWNVSNVQSMINMFDSTSSFQGVSWYTNTQNLTITPNEYVSCYLEEEVFSMCHASTSCWYDHMNVTSWMDYVNKTDSSFNIYETNISVNDDVVYISGLAMGFCFPVRCSVTCSSACWMDSFYFD
jgi:surface protein